MTMATEQAADTVKDFARRYRGAVEAATADMAKINACPVWSRADKTQAGLTHHVDMVATKADRDDVVAAKLALNLVKDKGGMTAALSHYARYRQYLAEPSPDSTQSGAGSPVNGGPVVGSDTAADIGRLAGAAAAALPGLLTGLMGLLAPKPATTVTVGPPPESTLHKAAPYVLGAAAVALLIAAFSTLKG